MRSEERLMLQDVWRKAYREGGLDIQFKTKAGATRGRLQLYNAVAEQKKEKNMEDLELVHAAQELEIVKLSETSLRMQLRVKNDMMTTLAGVLGQSLEAFVDPAAAEAAERMLKQLEEEAKTGKPSEPAFGHRENPFYGNRDQEK